MSLTFFLDDGENKVVLAPGNFFPGYSNWLYTQILDHLGRDDISLCGKNQKF